MINHTAILEQDSINRTVFNYSLISNRAIKNTSQIDSCYIKENTKSKLSSSVILDFTKSCLEKNLIK